MNYQQTIEYLYKQLPMFTRIGAAAYKKDLHNTIQLCESFDNPQNKFRSIHIAGTNGKGSCSHMLAAIFQQAGYKTGLYTSPHLKDFRERIRINGDMIPESYVTEFTGGRSMPLIEKIEPSFFELTVVMAFEYFATEQVDIAIIETGLGGRLDSTNIIRPELSVITNIGLDHMNILGDTLEKIAAEKAGIIKRGVPVVIGETLPETRTVFEKTAEASGSELIFAEEKYQVLALEQQPGFLHCVLENRITKNTGSFQCDLPGLYQAKNLQTVITAVDRLQASGYKLPAGIVKEALTMVKKLTGLHGRWEQVHDKPMVILDVGHNEDGIKQIINNINSLKRPGRQFSIVIGMVKDKEIEKVLSLFPQDFRYYFTNANLPRALPAAALQAVAVQKGLKGKAYENVNIALGKALEEASTEDAIIVCGSVFVVGEVEPF